MTIGPAELDHVNYEFQATTPINIKKLSDDLKHHPDRTFVQYLLSGLQEGFDPLIYPVPHTSYECGNNLSAHKLADFVDSAISRELTQKYIVGPFDTPPFEVYRISPLGVAQGKYSRKNRLILDLSAPHTSATESINDLIDKEFCSLEYVSMDDAIHILRCLGPGTWMCKTDITDAFKQVPIRADLWRYFGFKWKSKYYFYVRLAFGCRSSPKIFNELSKAIVWIAKNKYQIKHMLWLLDDFITFDARDEITERSMAIVSLLFRSLNIPTAPHKTVGPVQVIEYLGITLDSLLMEARLPREKILRMTNILQTFLQKRSCTLREVQVVLGHLNFACRVIVPGRSFISYLIGLLKSQKVGRSYFHVRVSGECRRDIAMWLSFLKNWNGVSVFLDSKTTSNADLNLHTDASSTVGYGGYYAGRWFSEKMAKRYGIGKG
jgi:hypothetical protein